MSDEQQTGSEKDIPPWLQPVPEEEEAGEGFLAGRKTLVISAAAALGVVILFVVALLTLYDDTSDGAPRHVVADTTPIREKPEAPGGMEVPHQDKQVFDQGAGTASEPVRLAAQPEQPLETLPDDPAEEEAPQDMDALVEQVTESESAAVTAPEPAAATPAAEEPAASAQNTETETEGAVVPAGSYKVQLGAYGSEASAERAWRAIRGKYRSTLEGLSPLYESVQSGDRTLYRLRVGPLASRAAADEVCLGLRAQQQACIVVNP